MRGEFNEKLCDERHKSVDELHVKTDAQTKILIRLDVWTKAHAKTHEKRGLRIQNVITSILALAAVVVAVFALTR